MAKNPKTIGEMLKTLLEEKLAERKIAWIRKDGGLMLALFGNPVIQVSDTGIKFGLIGSTNGYHGNKDYVFLEYNHGDLTNPDCDPEGTIEKVLSVCDNFSNLMNQATNNKDINEMRLITVPASRAKAAIKKLVVAQFPTATVDCYNGIYQIKRKDHRNNQTGSTRIFELNEVVADGDGNILSRGNNWELVPLADAIKYKLT